MLKYPESTGKVDSLANVGLASGYHDGKVSIAGSSVYNSVRRKLKSVTVI